MKRVEHYEIGELKLLTDLGTVFTGVDITDNHKVTMLKFNESITRDSNLKRMLNDATVSIRALEHPNLLNVDDYLDLGAEAYLVIEPFEGRTLKRVISDFNNRLPIGYALPIFRQLLLGLSYSHVNGVVHCSLDLENILVSNDNQVKISELGFSELKSLAQFAIMGEEKELFLSPEQIFSGKHDEMSDIFIVSAILFFALTGINIVTLRMENELEWQVMEENLNTDLRLFDNSIPQWIANILQIGLSPNGKDRYHTAKDFLNALKIR